MSLESGSMHGRKSEGKPTAENEVRLNLPSILGRLPAEEQSRFDNLMMSVIPWRGEAYTLGINGLFRFVPIEMVEEIVRYVHELPSESQNTDRERLLGKMRIIYSEKKFNEMSNEQLLSFT